MIRGVFIGALVAGGAVAALLGAAQNARSDGGGASSPCVASDAATFHACIDRARAGGTGEIAIAALIRCDDPAAPCAFAIDGLRGRLIVRGDSSDLDAHPVGFRRTKGYANSILTVSGGGAPVIVRNLVFDEGSNVAFGRSGEIWKNKSCGRADECYPIDALDVTSARRVLVDGCRFLNAKTFGIAVSGSSSIFIRNSRFVHSWIHGIWIDAASSGVHVENNEFVDNRSNAVLMSAAAPAPSDPLRYNTISGNVFRHNHNAAVYHGCAPGGTGPCEGGQIYLEKGATSVLIENNDVGSGALDEDPAISNRHFTVAGVELASTGINDVTIFNNYFHDLSGVAAYVNEPTVDVGGITIRHNYFHNICSMWGNAATCPVAHAELLWKDSQRCQAGTGCGTFHMPKGRLAAAKAAGHALALTWNTAHALEPIAVIEERARVILRTRDPAGRRTVSAPGGAGTPLDLYSGGTLLDSLLRIVR